MEEKIPVQDLVPFFGFRFWDLPESRSASEIRLLPNELLVGIGLPSTRAF